MLGGIRQIWKEGGIPGFFTGYKCVFSCGPICAVEALVLT